MIVVIGGTFTGLLLCLLVFMLLSGLAQAMHLDAMGSKTSLRVLIVAIDVVLAALTVLAVRGSYLNDGKTIKTATAFLAWTGVVLLGALSLCSSLFFLG